MSTLVQRKIYYRNDRDAGLEEDEWCPDMVVGDECPSGCLLGFSDGGGNTSQPDYYEAMVYSISNACFEETTLSMTYDAFSVRGNIFSIYVDNALFWNTACMVGTGSDNVVIPAGTHSVRFTVIGSCAGGTGDLWSWTSVCS